MKKTMSGFVARQDQILEEKMKGGLKNRGSREKRKWRECMGA